MTRLTIMQSVLIELAQAIGDLAHLPSDATYDSNHEVFNKTASLIRMAAWRLETGQLTGEFWDEEDKITEKASAMRKAVPRMVMPRDGAVTTELNTNVSEAVGPGVFNAKLVQVDADRPAIAPIAIEILQECISVLRERGATYADIEDNSNAFTGIMTNFGMQIPMSPTNYHCLSNIATKLARFATGDQTHEDTFIDISNYAVLMCAVTRRNKLRDSNK